MGKCCNSCAYLACNKGKPTPKGSELDWYAQENLDRLWNEVKDTGQFLICHSTDSTAKTYGGNEKIKPGNETACLGITLAIYMHIKVYEVKANYNFRIYRNLVGHKVAMNKYAMGNAAVNLATGSTGFGTSGPLKGMLIPQTINEDREFTFPSGFEKVKKLYDEIMSAKQKAA